MESAVTTAESLLVLEVSQRNMGWDTLRCGGLHMRRVSHSRILYIAFWVKCKSGISA